MRNKHSGGLLLNSPLAADYVTSSVILGLVFLKQEEEELEELEIL